MRNDNMRCAHVLMSALIAVAAAGGCGERSKTTGEQQQPHAGGGGTGSAPQPAQPPVTGDRSGVPDGGPGDAGVGAADGGGGGGSASDRGVKTDEGAKTETPFDDESSPPPIPAAGPR
jgi:hypothetical protein